MGTVRRKEDRVLRTRFLLQLNGKEIKEEHVDCACCLMLLVTKKNPNYFCYHCLPGWQLVAAAPAGLGGGDKEGLRCASAFR